jgi:hypothetical protein
LEGEMALYKLDRYYPNYRDQSLACFDIKNFSVHTKDELVSSVTNILVDEHNGRFRYFVIDTGFWVFSIKVLLPVGLVRVDYDYKRLFVPGLTKEHINNLPEFEEDFVIDYDYEERVRNVYRPLVRKKALNQFCQPTTYKYKLEPYFYEVRDRNLKMYEEQLISKKYSHQLMRAS